MPEITIYSLTALMALVIFMMCTIGRLDNKKLRKISPFELNMYRD
jgi:hypothetical protein